MLRKEGGHKLLPIIIALLIVLTTLCAYFGNSYYARVNVIRHFFKNKGAVPNDYLLRTSILQDIEYGSVFPNGVLDVYTANDVQTPCPIVLWIHGGGYVGGDKSCVRTWAHVIADETKAAVVSINYCLAPDQHYPGPLLQIGEALQFLRDQSDRFSLDFNRIFLAGDSAGAQIASQYAAIVCNESYRNTVKIVPPITRDNLRGILLCCGFYNPNTVVSSRFPAIRTFLWAYTNTKKIDNYPRKDELNVISHITENYCDAFVTCGNSDPFLRQSLELTEALERKNVPAETYFPSEKKTGHEYQFLLGTPAANAALRKAVKFIEERI